MTLVSLDEIYRDPCRVAITAHRGFSGRWPENTLQAFAAAVAMGVDLLECDLRPTRCGTPVIIHDAKVDRTTDGHGEISAHSLAEAKALNASWWAGSHADGGQRRVTPAEASATIPTFAELLDAFAGRVGLNIHVKATPPLMLAEVCRLFRRHNLYASAYLTMHSYTEAAEVHRIDGLIPLCVLEDQGQMDEASLRRQHAFGARVAQPMRHDIYPGRCATARALGLPTNVFFANTPEVVTALANAGVQGLLTDWPDRVISTLKQLGRR